MNGWSELRRHSWTATCGIVAVVLGLYVGAYFVFSKGDEILDMSRSGSVCYQRRFASQMPSRAFLPLGWLECKMRGVPVYFAYPSNDAPGWDEIDHQFDP